MVLVARGLHNDAIADRLAISQGTVKVHLHNIYEPPRVLRRARYVRTAMPAGAA